MISGGIKYFEKPSSLNSDGASGIASSGTDSVVHMLTSNSETFYRSVGSADGTVETIDITLSASSDIDRLYVRDINWKQFTMQYKTGGTWTDFTNVISIKSSTAAALISVTDWDQDTAYFEFDKVTTTDIRITITNTQVVNAEKYANWFISTAEYGTFVGYPQIKKITQDRNIKLKKTLSGKYSSQASTEALEYEIAFENYIVSDEIYNADLDLVMTLNDLNEGFLVWLCGGKFGRDNFQYTLRGFRLIDIKLMKFRSKFNTGYMSSIYVNPVDLKYKLIESIN
ncbi:hypothetical protein KAR91_40810 [Candidatus Pacearchaeota archaeon]|nr:hypothetical protein [Candidatus Pacearchaeota archaeon]